ncbi:MAG: alpha/beta hydrolase family protein [Gaiellaceae bacterium]
MSSGFVLELADERRPRWDGPGPRPVRTHVWPAGEAAARVVLVSHGTGGSAWQMTWLAEPLAEAGFLVAAVDHHGNNFADGYVPQGFAFWWERALDLSFVLDALSNEYEVSSAGAAGFSLGGYTVAALAGARVDAELYRRLRDGDLELAPPPEFPDLAEHLQEHVRGDTYVAAGASYRDPRICAAFVVCPALAGILDPASLAAIDLPFAVRWARADELAPDAHRYAELIPDADGSCAGDQVGHYDFLHSTEGAEPVRAAVAAEAVDFFRRNLP